MSVTYIGSRKHVLHSLEKLQLREPLVVVDAVTLNREAINDRIKKIDPHCKRLIIRPKVVAQVHTKHAAEYLQWLDATETSLRSSGDTTTLFLPRVVEDWKDDIGKAVEFNSFYLVEPGDFISLIDRKRFDEILQGAALQAVTGAEIRMNKDHSVFPATAMVEILESELNQPISLEQVKASDLYEAMVDAGMSATLSNRIVAAQQLVVSKTGDQKISAPNTSDDIRHYVATMKG